MRRVRSDPCNRQAQWAKGRVEWNTSVWVGVSNVSRVRKVSTQWIMSKSKWDEEGMVPHNGALLNIPLTEPVIRSRAAWKPPAPSPWNPLQHSHLAVLPLGFSQQTIEHGENTPIANCGWGTSCTSNLVLTSVSLGTWIDSEGIHVFWCQKLLGWNKKVLEDATKCLLH